MKILYKLESSVHMFSPKPQQDEYIDFFFRASRVVDTYKYLMSLHPSGNLAWDRTEKDVFRRKLFFFDKISLD